LRDKATTVVKTIIIMTTTITTILMRRRITITNNRLHLLQIVSLQLRRGFLQLMQMLLKASKLS